MQRRSYLNNKKLKFRESDRVCVCGGGGGAGGGAGGGGGEGHACARAFVCV